MDEREHQAVEAARHELVTLNGLMAHDGPDPRPHFQVDTTAAIRQLDAILSDGHYSRR